MVQITPELLGRVNRGDHQACMDVVTMHLPLLKSLAYKYKLEDIITQGWYDTVLALEQSIAAGTKFHQHTDLTGYISRVIRGRSVDIKKNNVLMPSKKLPWVQIPYEFISAPPETEVHEALDFIPEGPLRATAYRKYMGQTVTDIAKALGVSRTTIYSYLNQIKELLRDET